TESVRPGSPTSYGPTFLALRPEPLPHDARPERASAAHVHGTLARREDAELARQSLHQLPALEQEGRIAWMADLALVDQEGVPDEDAARPQPATHLGEQPSIEEVEHNDGVHGSGTHTGRIEVHLYAGDARVHRAHPGERRSRDVDRDHAMSARGQEH